MTGLDLTPAYCELARELSKAAGLAQHTRFECGNAQALPFERGAFDVVWTEHLQMNVQDKAGLYRQIERVLKPHGQLVFHEIFGDSEMAPSAFPVPWADERSISFLTPAAEVDELLRRLRLEPVVWEDRTEASQRWCEVLNERLAAEGPPSLGLHLLMGESAKQKLMNMGQSLRDNGLQVVQAVYRKPKK